MRGGHYSVAPCGATVRYGGKCCENVMRHGR